MSALSEELKQKILAYLPRYPNKQIQCFVFEMYDEDTKPIDPGQFPGWCRGVARNVVLHHWRDRKKTVTSPSAGFLEAVELAYQEGDSKEDDMDLRRRALRECLKQLPETSRNLLELRYVRRAPSEEVARTLGRSAAGVRMALMRVRQALSACIEGRMAGVAR